MLLGLITLAAVGVLVWLYGRWKHNYWKRMGVPTPPTTIVVGHFHHTFSSTTPIWEWRDKVYYKIAGKLFSGGYNFFTPQLMVADPQLLRSILVKDFDHFTERRHLDTTGNDDKLLTEMLSNATGERWQQIRNAVTPAFTSGRLKTMFPLIAEKAKLFMQVSRTVAQKSEPVEVKKFAGRYAMDATASCGFGIEANSLLDEADEFGKRAAVIFNPSMKRILQFVAFYVAPRFCNAIGMSVVSPHLRYYADVVTEVLKHREETGTTRGDFIDLMIEARKIPNENTRAGKKHALEDMTVVAQAVLFLVAGFGNLATTLAFCSYQLARDQHIQEQAREEIAKLKRKYGDELCYDAIMEAKFLEACISETLRLYPVESTLDRECVKNYKLGETGITVPKGMIIEVPIWSLHRDPEYWPQPEEFRPERFLEENKKDITPYTYLPFGLGPRNCIGLRFSMLVMKTGLAYLLQGVDMKVAPSQSHPIELACSPLVLRPKIGIDLLFEVRHEKE